MNDLFLRALQCKVVSRPPVWLMRQAGRYMPQYQEYKKHHSLSELFHDPELCASITAMAVDVLGVDAAILFSDILVLAEAFGSEIRFPETGGPYIYPQLTSPKEVRLLKQNPVEHCLSYVKESVIKIKERIDVPLIGFCGAPFTLACYWVDGGSSHQFAKIKQWIEQHEEEFCLLLDKIAQACIDYLRMQVLSGADAVQIFDSWASILSREEFQKYALFYWKKILDGLLDLNVPVIVFCRGSSTYPREIASLMPSAISFDENRPLHELREIVAPSIAVQGNLSSELLLHATPEEIRKKTEQILLSIQGKNGIIMNLGHGILPKTPMANVHAFIDTIKNFS